MRRPSLYRCRITAPTASCCTSLATATRVHQGRAGLCLRCAMQCHVQGLQCLCCAYAMLVLCFAGRAASLCVVLRSDLQH